MFRCITLMGNNVSINTSEDVHVLYLTLPQQVSFSLNYETLQVTIDGFLYSISDGIKLMIEHGIGNNIERTTLYNKDRKYYTNTSSGEDEECDVQSFLEQVLNSKFVTPLEPYKTDDGLL